MLNVTSQALIEASEIAQQIEDLKSQLADAQAIQKQIDELQVKLEALIGSSSKPRKMNSEKRNNIAAGIRASWAKRKAAKQNLASPAPTGAVTVEDTIPTADEAVAA